MGPHALRAREGFVHAEGDSIERTRGDVPMHESDKTGSALHGGKRALRQRRRERAGPALEILRDLAMRIERRPTEDELVERLARESGFSSLDEDELLRSARRAINEGRRLERLVLKPSRDRRKRAREAFELDKDFDHADPEDALANPIFVGGPGLPKRRTMKVGRTR